MLALAAQIVVAPCALADDAPSSKPEAVDESKQPSSATAADTGSGKAAPLSGGVAKFDPDSPFAATVESLVDAACARDPKMEELDKEVKHFRRKAIQATANTKDVVNSAVPYRGFAQSSEAADVILNEEIEIKNKASAEYARQRLADRYHPLVTAKVLQVAMGLGCADKDRADSAIKSGLDGLRRLVGDDAANGAFERLKSWSQDMIVPEKVFQQPSWDAQVWQEKTRTATKIAIESDPVMQEVMKRVYKYNHRSRLARWSAGTVESALSLMSWLSPGFLIPAAFEVMNGAFVMANGGPEDAKLLKELYFDKRIESRWRAVNEEAQIALGQYQAALYMRNPVLLVSAESVLSHLVGNEKIGSVLDAPVIARKPVDNAALADGQKADLKAPVSSTGKQAESGVDNLDRGGPHKSGAEAQALDTKGAPISDKPSANGQDSGQALKTADKMDGSALAPE